MVNPSTIDCKSSGPTQSACNPRLERKRRVIRHDAYMATSDELSLVAEAKTRSFTEWAKFVFESLVQLRKMLDNEFT